MTLILSATSGHLSPPFPPPRSRTPKQPLKAVAAAAPFEDTIIVAGGGPAGLAASVALQRIGIPTLVFEKDSPPAAAGGTALGLWTNAWRALDALGAGDSLRSLHPKIDSVELCRENGRKLTQFSIEKCHGGPHEFRGVRRAHLIAALASQLEQGSVKYGLGVVSVTVAGEVTLASRTAGVIGKGRGGGGVDVTLSDGSVLRCAAVLGADGARSATALSTGLRGPANYAGQVAVRGVACFPDGKVPVKGIRQVLGAGVRAGMYPISSTEVYWFVVMYAPEDAQIPPTPEDIREEALKAVAGWDACEVPAVIRATPAKDVTRSRIADRWDLPKVSDVFSVERNGSFQRPLVTLVGDALHPMTPNLGQGGCTALEDAVVLARAVKSEIGAGADAWRTLDPGEERCAALAAAFKKYEIERVRRCLPLTVRSYAMGALLQLGQPPVVAVRDAFVEKVFNPSHFLDHAMYDCGTL